MATASNWRRYQWDIILKVENVRSAIGDRCFHCSTPGSKKNQLEFAHLQPTGLNGRSRGAHHRRLDLLKNLDKYTYLCNHCHKEFDGNNTQGIKPQSIAERLLEIN